MCVTPKRFFFNWNTVISIPVGIKSASISLVSVLVSDGIVKM